MGDFNYPEINYKDGTVMGTKSPASCLLRTTQDLFFTQYISEPTRMREGVEPSTRLISGPHDIVSKPSFTAA